MKKIKKRTKRPVRFHIAKNIAAVVITLLLFALAMWIHDGFFVMLITFAMCAMGVCLVQILLAPLLIKLDNSYEKITADRGLPYQIVCNVRHIFPWAWTKIYAVFTMSESADAKTKKYYNMSFRGGFSEKLSVTVTPQYKGKYYAAVCELYVSDVLGIFTRKIKGKMPEKENLYVTPRSFVPKTYANASGGLDDMAKQAQILADNMSVSVPRTYTKGDPLKRVDWKTTARKRELYVKSFDEDDGNYVSVIMLAQTDSRENDTIAAEIAVAAANKAFALHAPSVRIFQAHTKQEKIVSEQTMYKLKMEFAEESTVNEKTDAERLKNILVHTDNAAIVIIPHTASEQVMSIVADMAGNATVYVLGAECAPPMLKDKSNLNVIALKSLSEWEQFITGGKQD